MLRANRAPFPDFDQPSPFCPRPRLSCVQDCARKFCWGACRGGDGIEVEDEFKDDVLLLRPI